MNIRRFLILLAALVFRTVCVNATNANLSNRSLIALRYGQNVYVSWRLLSTDNCKTTCFNVYRDNTIIASHLGNSTFFDDGKGNAKSTYKVETVVNGTVTETCSVKPWNGYYKSYTFERPAETTINETGEKYTYVPDGIMPVDVDGDGNLEFIVRWNPTNKKDNSQNGYTGPVYIDCYKPTDLCGTSNAVTRLWRINMGRNIRAGAHYTQLLVHDFDDDGKAELILKTAPGTIDGQGNYASLAAADPILKAIDNTEIDYNANGRIYKGAEMLTVFNGTDGSAVNTIWYNPNRAYSETGIAEYPDNGEAYWGDSYENRSERYLGGVAYLDGHDKNPSAILTRGYYTIAYMWAVDYKNGKLTPRWRNYSRKYGLQYDVTTYNTDGTESTKSKITATANTFGMLQNWPADNRDITGSNTIAGSGSHQLQIGDCDSDGKDEIVFGSAAVDNDGYMLFSTGLGHGDATHLGDFIPDHKGLEIIFSHEEFPYGWDCHDASTGERLIYYTGKGDTGSGVVANFYPARRGYEIFSSDTHNIYSSNNDLLLSADSCGQFGEMNSSFKHRILWEGTTNEDFYYDNNIWCWNPSTMKIDRVTPFNTKDYGYGVSIGNYDSKANPIFIGDILGDWREEIILLNNTNKDTCSINIYPSTCPTSYRVPTLTANHNYETTLATQLVGYRMMPNLDYYLPDSIQSYILPDDSTETETISTTDAGYGTYVTEHALDFTNAAMKAYIITAVDKGGNVATLMQVTKVPAHTPIIIEGAKGEDGTVGIPVISRTTLNHENLLQYSTEAIAPTAKENYTYYVLAVKDNAVGLYPVIVDTTIMAGKCFLKLAGTVDNVKAIYFSTGKSTGVKNIAAISRKESTDAAIYSLSGIRLVSFPRNHELVITKGKIYDAIRRTR